MLISGNNFQFGQRRTDDSYYFSRHTHIWGWASWRRAWRLYDPDMLLYPQVREGNWLDDILGDKRLVDYWKNVFDRVYARQIDTWDYQLTFAAWINNALTVLPHVNLITNIGFGETATHTGHHNVIANLPSEAMTFPLHHPNIMIADTISDRRTDRIYLPPPRLVRRINRIISDIRKTFR